MKKLKIFISLIICILCVFSLSSCKYKYIFKGYIEVNKELPETLNSSKSIAEYALDIVENDCGIEFEIGSVYMILDSEQKGEVKVTLVEKGEKKPMLVYVEFDTKSNKLLRFNYVSWDSKLHPGIINLQNWKVDYAETIEITKEFYSKTGGFRYDEAIIRTCNSYPDQEYWEDWLLTFYDMRNGKKYHIRIDPYTGEITSHGIFGM